VRQDTSLGRQAGYIPASFEDCLHTLSFVGQDRTAIAQAVVPELATRRAVHVRLDAAQVGRWGTRRRGGGVQKGPRRWGRKGRRRWGSRGVNPKPYASDA
jgi:hypothetical protein